MGKGERRCPGNPTATFTLTWGNWVWGAGRGASPSSSSPQTKCSHSVVPEDGAWALGTPLEAEWGTGPCRFEQTPAKSRIAMCPPPPCLRFPENEPRRDTRRGGDSGPQGGALGASQGARPQHRSGARLTLRMLSSVAKVLAFW